MMKNNLEMMEVNLEIKEDGLQMMEDGMDMMEDNMDTMEDNMGAVDHEKNVFCKNWGERLSKSFRRGERNFGWKDCNRWQWNTFGL